MLAYNYEEFFQTFKNPTIYCTHITYFYNEIITGSWGLIEVYNFWTEFGRHLVVHFITSSGQSSSNFHMIFWQAILIPQSHSARHKTYKMILKNEEKYMHVLYM